MDRAFGNIVYELRVKANFSQAVLAKKAGLSQSAVSRIEGGSRWPCKKTIVCICNAFNIGVDELFALATNSLKNPDAKRWISLEYEEGED